MKLDGKRVLITGGSSGIGLAIAHALLAKGAKVGITVRRSAVLSTAVEALRKNDGSVTGIVADVGTEEGRALTLQQARLTRSEASTSWSTMPAGFAQGVSKPPRRRRSRRC
jgi:NAD(P)-dependent dehydrogenase (short-subunit alcohol dehydrogenase family)